MFSGRESNIKNLLSQRKLIMDCLCFTIFLVIVQSNGSYYEAIIRDAHVCMSLFTLIIFLLSLISLPSHLSTVCFSLPILEELYFQKIEANCTFTKEIYHLNKSLSFSTEAKGLHFVSLSILYIFMQYIVII